MNIFLLILQHLFQRFRQMNDMTDNPADYAVASTTGNLPPIMNIARNGGHFTATVRLCRFRFKNFKPEDISITVTHPHIVITARKMSKTEIGETFTSREVTRTMQFPFSPSNKPTFAIKSDTTNPHHIIVSLYMKLEKQLTSTAEDSLFDLDDLS